MTDRNTKEETLHKFISKTFRASDPEQAIDNDNDNDTEHIESILDRWENSEIERISKDFDSDAEDYPDRMNELITSLSLNYNTKSDDPKPYIEAHRRFMEMQMRYIKSMSDKRLDMLLMLKEDIEDKNIHHNDKDNYANFETSGFFLESPEQYTTFNER